MGRRREAGGGGAGKGRALGERVCHENVRCVRPAEVLPQSHRERSMWPD